MWKSISVIILMNGLKIQWGMSNVGHGLETINLTVLYSSKSSYRAFVSDEKIVDFSSGGGAEYAPQTYLISGSQFKIDQQSSSQHRVSWFSIGY